MTQKEFELQLQTLKEDCLKAIHPVLDKQRENLRHRARLEAEINLRRTSISQLKEEYLEFEQKRKDIARQYSDLEGKLKKEYLREEMARDNEPARQPGGQEQFNHPATLQP